MGKIYENLTIDEIYQLEFQAGKKATEIIDRVMSDNKEIKEQVCSFTEEDNGKILQIGADGKIVALESSEGLTIDPSLTTANSAADAKAAGDGIKAVQNTLNFQSQSTPIAVTYKDKYIKTNGSTVSIATRYDSSGWNCSVVSCYPGDKFMLNGVGGDEPRLWAFIDNSGNNLLCADASAGANRLQLTAPEDTKYLIINDSSGQTSYYGLPVFTRLKNMDDELSDLKSALESIGLTIVNGALYIQPVEYIA